MFNKSSRKKNAMLVSGMSTLSQVISNVAAFIYRTVFIYCLSEEYLGINGLFSNIIQLFSLAELGIGSVIGFHLYKPIKEEDIDQTAELMRFYKHFYQLIAFAIILIGVALSPFLPYIIHDAKEIPSDINLYVVYALYIFQSATSYTFSYRQTLLNADQKGYIVTATQTIFTCVRYIISIIVVYLTRNYTLVLISTIVINLLNNLFIYLYVGHFYAEIFRNKSRMKKEGIIQIFKDAGAMMCHRIGATVVTSTDNIIMSMYVGTVSVGIYSNYLLIIQMIQNIISSSFASFASSIGNYVLTVKGEERYQLYKKLRFANMWIVVFCTSSLYLLINPFIQIVWGKNLIFSKEIVFILCTNFFLFASRSANGAFNIAAGTFVYDKTRPLIESALNLFISVALVKRIGVSGVFLGTIISSGLTVWWREPYLLFKKVFDQKLGEYFITYAFWVVLLFTITIPFEKLLELLPLNMFYLVIRFLICGIGINVILVLIMCRNQYFCYYLEFIKRLLAKKFKHRN